MFRGIFSCYGIGYKYDLPSLRRRPAMLYLVLTKNCSSCKPLCTLISGYYLGHFNVNNQPEFYSIKIFLKSLEMYKNNLHVILTCLLFIKIYFLLLFWPFMKWK